MTLRGVALGCGLAMVVVAVPMAETARADVVTYPATGGEQSFVVPTGVTSIDVFAVGGHGGPSAPTGATTRIQGGAAAQVTGTISVTPGEVLYVEVGSSGAPGVGSTSVPASFGGGGGAAKAAGGGGGASDLRTRPASVGLGTDTRLLVAAGGGGAGLIIGGSGSGQSGGDADAAGKPSGASATSGGGPGGPPATTIAGGTAGTPNGGAGSLGIGGAGGAGPSDTYGGGGGAGGYAGGGGGGGGSAGAGSGGGGGGSSLKAPGGSIALAAADAAPQIRLTYTPVAAAPAPVSLPAPAGSGLLGTVACAVLTRSARASVSGRLDVRVTCDRDARIRLTGPVTDRRRARKGRQTPKTRRFIFAPVSALVGAGTTRTVTLRLPRVALTDLRHRAKVSAAVTLTVVTPSSPKTTAITVRP